MARKKRLDRYPDKYWSLINKAWKEPVFIPCEDAFRARSLRNELYNFRLALKDEAQKNDRLAITFHRAEALVFSVTNPTTEHPYPRLIISRKESVNTIPPGALYD